MNNPPAGSILSDSLSASVQILPLAAGLYLFSVKAASGSPQRTDGQLKLPAMHVGLGPGVRSDQVQFIAGPTTDGAWLFAREDCLITKISGGGATLVLTSVRGPGGETLSIKVERLGAGADSRSEAPAPGVRPPTVAGDKALNASSQSNGHDHSVPVPKKKSKAMPRGAEDVNAPLPVQVSAHIRTRGDMHFTDAWAGRLGPGLWIESFAVKPLARFEAQDIEYKGLTGSGFETPWLSDAAMCGTKGMAVPLVGFAIRLKPGKETAAFDCEYSGYFKSGATVGPLRNGAPCRSAAANDPLEGIQVQLRKRNKATALPTADAPGSTLAAAEPKTTPLSGPSFGRYRDAPAEGHKTNGGAPPSKRSTRRA